MTSDELVKALLTEESSELYDKIRVDNILKNLSLGYGKMAIITKHIVVTYSGGKSRKVIYNIPKQLLTKEQISLIQKLQL